jgi:hypothetical protein
MPANPADIKKVTERSQIIFCFQRTVFLFRKDNGFGRLRNEAVRLSPPRSLSFCRCDLVGKYTTIGTNFQG